MTVTFDIPKEIEDRLRAEAQASGVPLAEFMRDFIMDRYQEEEEDRRIAEARLNDPQPPVSGAQLRKNLGLDS
jgi:hypothetical protein